MEQPRFLVVARSASFERVWPELAGELGGVVEVGGGLAELSPVGESCGVVVAVGGVEEEAAGVVVEVRAGGAREVVVVGSVADHRLAVSVVRSGASDYFALPGDLGALRSWWAERVERAERAGRARELAAYERGRFDFSRLVGRSPGLVAALERAARVIPRGGATVLLEGETGTGKELLAQAIHFNGPRAAEPFVEVNCSALPATLLEAELFGYERGAFTDARAAKPGLFEAAHGGTLFLDEVGELGLELQAKLLRVLEDRQVRRLGSVRPVRVDVRIIAATHRDLAAEVRAGRFREDLYYRLNVVPIHLPPLRERGEDVLLLAEHFLEQFSAEYGIPRPALTPEARQLLLVHPWPGNVRELRNAMERAVLLGDGRVEPEHILAGGLEGGGSAGRGAALPFPAPLDAIARAAARAMVERCGGNKSMAAAALGISRSRLYRLLARSEPAGPGV